MAMNTPPQVPAGLKVATTVGFIVIVTLVPASRPGWLLVAAILLLAALVVARIDFAVLLRRLLWLSPFVAGTALAAALGGHGLDLHILAARSGLCLVAALLLAQTTPFSDLLAVLRAAGVPALLITTLTLMHRYLFVLGDEASRMTRARAARTFTSRRWFAWLGAASVVGQLFVRASERAERVYDAMCARGWKS